MAKLMSMLSPNEASMVVNVENSLLETFYRMMASLLAS